MAHLFRQLEALGGALDEIFEQEHEIPRTLLEERQRAQQPLALGVDRFHRQTCALGMNELLQLLHEHPQHHTRKHPIVVSCV